MQLSSWGQYPQTNSHVLEFEDTNQLKEIIRTHKPLIPYGNGRSYGDSALGENQLYVKPHSYMLSFDETSGVLHCQAGVLLSEILETFIPRGWFLSVTPGTKLITIGGAIASDVHGKNHHTAGSFCDHVVDFKLMLPSGDILTVSKEKTPDLFKATCGGMGLTGVILEAHIQLQQIQSSMIEQTIVKTRNLQELFKAFESFASHTYSVAWIDCLAGGSQFGRGLLTAGEHATDGNLSYNPGFKAGVPFDFPNFVLNRFSMKVFNMLYYNKVLNQISHKKVSIDSFFYPLDAINHWNRIYGKGGFTQYQFVLPKANSYEGLEKIMHRIVQSGRGSFLAVLKLLGKENQNWLSFPMEGYTLAVDFKIEPGLFEMLNDLDKIVIEHGGRVYLTKDVRIPRENFEAGYPHVADFRKLRKEMGMRDIFNSLQSKRIGI